jgi:predicted extracellular nuclease
MKRALCAVAIATAFAATPALAKIEITEWMYNGDEFIELTNMGNTPIDMTGWSYDDDSRVPGTVSLSAFGTVAVGESMIIAENASADFRSSWQLGGNVKIIGGNQTNLGRADEINIFDSTGTLVDRFAYGDNTVAFAGTIRTLNISGNPTSLAALVPNNVTTDWVLSTVGDAYGSYASLDGFVANPGTYFLAPVPEPESYALMLAGCALVGAAIRRRRSAV